MRTILEHMKLEHLYLYEQWKLYCSEENKERKKFYLMKFEENMARHTKLEEGKLSPTFNKYLNIDTNTSATKIISEGRTKLYILLDRIKALEKQEDIAGMKTAENHFLKALLKFQKKEEEKVYTIFDHIILIKDWKRIMAGEI